MENNIRGKIWKYGDNIDTDVIIPARYLTMTDPNDLAKHCMEDIDKNFAANVSKNDIIVAGENFGCGSSREHAPIAIKECGISAVIAKSFARIFYRNAINIGLPILENIDAANDAECGDIIEIDLSKGEIKNITKNKSYQTTPFPESIQKIIKSGGLIEYTKARISHK
ncbi:MAG: 3-isopropylmalate dehydratase small subunit [Candidatus Gastranaerophilales bacterium]|nr:3-isopropylmalate dehydratase small subunit [Candidatus Gastranaerophilales bacterium]